MQVKATCEKCGAVGVVDAAAAGTGYICPVCRQAAMGWYIAVDAQRYGPYGDDQLMDFIMEGRVKAHTLMWREGMGQWQRADACMEFAEAFETPTLVQPLVRRKEGNPGMVAAVLVLLALVVLMGAGGLYLYLQKRNAERRAKLQAQRQQARRVIVVDRPAGQGPAGTRPSPKRPTRPTRPETGTEAGTESGRLPSTGGLDPEPGEGELRPPTTGTEVEPVPGARPRPTLDPEPEPEPKEPVAAPVRDVNVMVEYEGTRVPFAEYWRSYQGAIREIAAREQAVSAKEGDIEKVRGEIAAVKQVLDGIADEANTALKDLSAARSEILEKAKAHLAQCEEALQRAFRARNDAREQTVEVRDDHGKVVGKTTVDNSAQYDAAVDRARAQLEQAKRQYSALTKTDPKTKKTWTSQAEQIKKAAREEGKPHTEKVRDLNAQLLKEQAARRELEGKVKAAERTVDAMTGALEPHRAALTQAGYVRTGVRFPIVEGQVTIGSGRWHYVGAGAPELRASLEAEAAKAKGLADNYWGGGRKDLARQFYRLVVERFPGTEAATEAAKRLEAQ
jgi:hypothetical protein